MNPRYYLTFVGIALGVSLIAWAVGAWLDHALAEAVAGIGSSR